MTIEPELPRARRRHQRWRMVRRAVALFRTWDAPPKNNVLDERGLCVKRRPHDPEKYADNLKACSCWMCANKCATEGPPMRERRWADDD